MEDEEAHCERCCDDRDDTSEFQEARILDQQRRGDSLECKNSIPRGQALCGVSTITGTHGHIVTALLDEMKDVRGSACLEN